MVWCIWYPDGQAIWTLLCTSVIRHLAFHQTDNFSKTLRMQSTCLLLLSRTNFSNPNLNSNHQMLKNDHRFATERNFTSSIKKTGVFEAGLMDDAMTCVDIGSFLLAALNKPSIMMVLNSRAGPSLMLQPICRHRLGSGPWGECCHTRLEATQPLWCMYK